MGKEQHCPHLTEGETEVPRAQVSKQWAWTGAWVCPGAPGGQHGRGPERAGQQLTSLPHLGSMVTNERVTDVQGWDLDGTRGSRVLLQGSSPLLSEDSSLGPWHPKSPLLPPLSFAFLCSQIFLGEVSPAPPSARPCRPWTSSSPSSTRGPRSGFHSVELQGPLERLQSGQEGSNLSRVKHRTRGGEPTLLPPEGISSCAIWPSGLGGCSSAWRCEMEGLIPRGQHQLPLLPSLVILDLQRLLRAPGFSCISRAPTCYPWGAASLGPRPL